MNPFFKQLGLFLFIILAALLILEFALRDIPNDYKYKSRYLKEKGNNIEFLILGNSHSLYAINPEYLSSKAFNCSGVSQSYDVDLAILRSSINNLDSLELICIPISYFSFFFDLRSSPEAWRIDNYNLYWPLEPQFAFNTEIFSRNFKINIKRIFDHYILKEKPLLINNLGWGNNYAERYSTDFNISANRRISRHNYLEKGIKDRSQEFRRQIESLKSIIELCNQKGLRLIFIQTPISHEYFSRTKKSQWETVYKELNQL